MALKGTLKDFPITDIFQLADQQGKSGILKLTNKSSEVRVLFSQGKVVGADSAAGKNREPLGAMLVRSGLVKQDALDEALEIQKKTLRKLGDILVSRNAISKEQLRQFLALQTQETIYRLFLWRTGEYEFLSEAPQYDPELATSLSAQHLVMDSLRMIDEWPSVRKTIVGLDAVPGRVESMEARVQRHDENAADEGDDLDADLDDAFAEWDDDSPSEEAADDSGGDDKIELTPGQTTVWDLVNGDRTVQQIVDRSLMGEFGTAKALAALVESGAVRILGRRKSQRTARISTLPTNRRERLVSTLWGFAASVGVILLAVGALLLVQTGGVKPVVSQHVGPGPGRTLSGALGSVREARTRRAMDVYFLMEGHYPDSPEELAAAGLH